MPVCEYCRPNKQLANENDLHQHITAEHPYRCTLCPDSLDFGSHYTWMNHYISQHKKRCPYCDAMVGENIVAKRNHFKQVHDYHPCILCAYCFESEDELVKHYKCATAESHPYVCNRCNKTLVNNHDFWYHCFEEHKAENCCPLCQEEVNNEFNDKIQWGEHLKLVHKLVPCSMCFEVFPNEHECKAHFKDQHRSVCSICQDDFPNEETRAKHYNTYHLFTCPHCPNMSFPDDAFKEEHLKVSHKAKCSICEAYFDTQIEFEHHYNDSHRFSCDYCIKSFPSDELLQSHVDLSHKYLCTVCDEYLSHGETLRYHYDVLHRLKCDLCAKECSSDTELRMHYSVAHTFAVHEELRFKHVCTDCQEVCVNEKELVVHYKEKHVRQWDVSPPPLHQRRSSSNY